MAKELKKIESVRTENNTNGSTYTTRTIVTKIPQGWLVHRNISGNHHKGTPPDSTLSMNTIIVSDENHDIDPQYFFFDYEQEKKTLA